MLFLPDPIPGLPIPRYLENVLLLRMGRTRIPLPSLSNNRRSPVRTPSTRRTSRGTVICPLLVILACFCIPNPLTDEVTCVTLVPADDLSLLSLWRSMPTLWRHGSSSLGSHQLSMSASRHPYSAGRFPSITEGTARPASTHSFPNCREGRRALAAPAGFKSVLMILCRESLISDYERFAREAPGQH